MDNELRRAERNYAARPDSETALRYWQEIARRDGSIQVIPAAGCYDKSVRLVTDTSLLWRYFGDSFGSTMIAAMSRFWMKRKVVKEGKIKVFSDILARNNGKDVKINTSYYFWDGNSHIENDRSIPISDWVKRRKEMVEVYVNC